MDAIFPQHCVGTRGFRVILFLHLFAGPGCDRRTDDTDAPHPQRLQCHYRQRDGSAGCPHSASGAMCDTVRPRDGPQHGATHGSAPSCLPRLFRQLPGKSPGVVVNEGSLSWSCDMFQDPMALLDGDSFW